MIDLASGLTGLLWTVGVAAFAGGAVLFGLLWRMLG